MRIAAIAARALGGCVDMIRPPRFRTVLDEFDHKIKMGCVRLGAEPLYARAQPAQPFLVLANRLECVSDIGVGTINRHLAQDGSIWVGSPFDEQEPQFQRLLGGGPPNCSYRSSHQEIEGVSLSAVAVSGARLRARNDNRRKGLRSTLVALSQPPQGRG